jgi:hypothetical protein
MSWPMPFAALFSVLCLAACHDASVSPPPPEGPVLQGFREVLVDSENLAGPWGKALADVDGDGLPDALVGLRDGPLYWYRYPDWHKFLIGPAGGGDDLLAADIDGDGAADAVTNGGAVVWYRNPRATGGAAGPWSANVIRPGGGSHDLAAADMDGDGRLDVVARAENGPTWIFLQRPGGKWEQLELHLGGHGTGTALGDVDGDGDIDVIGNGYWLEHPGEIEGRWDRHDFAAWDRTSAVGLADIDGDGRKDIFLSVGHGNGNISWFEAPADPEQGDWKEHVIGAAGYVHRFHLADMDGDGDLDVVFAEQREVPGRRVGIFLNGDGKGGTWPLRVIAHEGAHNIALGDVGGDGDSDVLGADWTEDTRLKLWENVPQGK